jgi:hypothetical protein
LRDPGWTCDGRRLVALNTADGPMSAMGRPAVIREDLVWLCNQPTRDMVRRYGTTPFAGGDHIHLGVRTD